jgi:hypothetical protein
VVGINRAKIRSEANQSSHFADYIIAKDAKIKKGAIELLFLRFFSTVVLF